MCVRILPLLLLVPAPSFAQVFFLKVDNTYSREWKQHHLQLFREYGLIDSIKEGGALGFWDAPEPEFQPQKGWILFLKPDGTVATSYFSTVDKEESFRRDFEKRVDRIRRRFPNEPEKVEVVIGKSLCSVQIPAHSPTPGGRSPAWEQHFRYENNVVVSSYGPRGAPGSNAVSEVPIGELAKLLRSAREKMTYVHCLPSRVSRKRRRDLLARAFKSIAPTLQRRNHEPSSDYNVRRASIETLYKLFESLLLDVEDVVFWEQWPANGKPYKTGCRAKVAAGSRLARWLGELRSGPICQLQDNGSIVAAAINLNLPSELQPFVLENVLRPLAGLHLQEEVKELVSNNGRIDVELRVDDHSQAGPTLQVAANTSNPDTLTKALRHLPKEIQFESGRWRRVVRSSQGQAQVLFTPAPIGQRTEEVFFKDRKRASDLVRVRADFSPWIGRDDSAVTSKLLQRMESMFLATVLRQYPWQGKSDSLRSRANPDGDWTVDAKLGYRGNTLNFSLSAGRDAHGFLLMQRHRNLTQK